MTGEQLGDLRATLGLTQQQLAVLLVVERRTVIRWEAGTLPIPDRSLFWLTPMKLLADKSPEQRHGVDLGQWLALHGPLYVWKHVLCRVVPL